MREEVKWTNLSRRQIAERLTAMGTPASRNACHNCSKAQIPQAEGPEEEGDGPRNPNRNAQFENIARLKQEYLEAG